MKKIKITIVLFILNYHFNVANAQSLNWKALDSTQHIVNTNFGLDYATSFGLGYAYKLNTERPILLNANTSIPFGDKIFDDFKIELGVQISLLNKSNFIGAISLVGIYRKHQTDLVRLQNFGSDIKGSFGYYKSKWFVAADVGFDKAIVTHFKHSQKFRDEVYEDVVDGWYEPATGGNFYYGFSTGYSSRKADITLNIGKIITQDFKTSPLLPFYLSLGYNFKIFK